MAMRTLMSLLTGGGGKGRGPSFVDLTIPGSGETRDQVNPQTGGVVWDDPWKPNLVDKCAGEGGQMGLPDSPARWESETWSKVGSHTGWGSLGGLGTKSDSLQLERKTNERLSRDDPHINVTPQVKPKLRDYREVLRHPTEDSKPVKSKVQRVRL